VRKRSTGWAIGAALAALALATAPASARADTDLVLTSSYSPSPATAGQNTTLTLKTENHGGAATHVKVQVALPAELHYVSGDAGCVYPDADGKVTCQLADIAAGGSATVHFIVMPSAAGTASAGAVVSSTEADTTPADNASTTNLTIDPAPKATPGISATVAGDHQAYDPQTLSATVTGGSSPTGKVDLQVFAPADTTCSGSPLSASIVTIDGAGKATSDAFVTGTGGTYHWTATYLGDAGNNSVSTTCGANDEDIKALPTIDLAVGVSGATATISNSLGATGTLTFTVYSDAACTTAIASATAAVNGDGSYPGAYALPGPGGYTVTVGYGGDARNAAESPGCARGGTVTIQSATTPPPPAPPADDDVTPAPPSNHFTFGSSKVSSTGTVTLSLTAPGAGRFTATARYGSTTFGKVTAGKSAKGGLKLTIRPSAAGRRLLKKHTRLKLSVSVTFTPTGGKPLTHKLSLTVKR
jgi:hypothetical protein